MPIRQPRTRQSCWALKMSLMWSLRSRTPSILLGLTPSLCTDIDTARRWNPRTHAKTRYQELSFNFLNLIRKISHNQANLRWMNTSFKYLVQFRKYIQAMWAAQIFVKLQITAWKINSYCTNLFCYKIIGKYSIEYNFKCQSMTLNCQLLHIPNVILHTFQHFLNITLTRKDISPYSQLLEVNSSSEN